MAQTQAGSTPAFSDRDPDGVAAAGVAVLFVSVIVLVVAQVAQILFPIMFEIGEDWDFIAAGLVALAVFGAPVVALAVIPLPTRSAVIVGAVLVAGALVVLRLIDPVPVWIAIACVGAALIGATAIAARLNASSAIPASALTGAVILGLAVDAALRALLGSWDLAWRDDGASIVVVVVLAVVLLGLAARVAGQSTSGGLQLRNEVWVAFGPFLMLQFLFLQNFAFVGSQAGVTYPVAVFTVLLADAIALAVTYGMVTLVPSHGLVSFVAAVAAVGLAWLIPLTDGVWVLVATAGLQALLAALMTLALRRRSEPPKLQSTVLAITGGSLLFLLLVLLWQLHIDQPLPFPRTAIPALAAAVVGRVGYRGAGAPATSRFATGVVVPALAAFIVLALAAPIILWATGPSLDPEPHSGEEIRVVNYNVRGSVDTAGQLAPDRIVAEIASSDPHVVVIQEAARGWPIHGTMDLVSYLQRELDMDFAYVAAADGQFGNAILSRLPMAETSQGLLPKDGSQDRSYVMVQIETANGPLAVVGTHLQSRSTEQVLALLDAAETTLPLVIAGDMNIAPTDPEVALFTDAGLVDVVGATGDRCRTTSAEPTSDCDRPDWVFITPNLQAGAVRIGTEGASDHLAMHVTLIR